MANKRKADPASTPPPPQRRPNPSTVPSTETIIRFYLIPFRPPLTGNVIAGGSFARPSEVLRLVSYLEGNIVRGLPGPVNRLPTLWDARKWRWTPAATPSHTLYKYIHRKVSWSTFVASRRQGIVCTLWPRFCLIVRWMERMEWIFGGGKRLLFSVYRLSFFQEF